MSDLYLRKVLILGQGVIGGNVLDLLTRMAEPFEITIVGRDEERLKRRVNLAIAVAMNLGRRPQVSYRTLDVTDIERTAETFAEIKPDIVVNATSLQTFWLISTLPREHYQALAEARIGPWLPNHLALTRKVMLALRSAQLKTQVINVSFPDTVNAVLGKVGLAPFIGAGNIANAIPTMKRAIAHSLDCPVERVDVRFFAHHFVGNQIASYGETLGAPYHLTAYLDGEEVTKRIDFPEVFHLFTTLFERVRGVAGQVMAATSVASIVRAIAVDSHELLHAPAPQGLVGGYPLRVGAYLAEVVLPTNLTLNEAIRINEGGQRYEGIECIDSDGTVHFADREMQIMKRILNYYCRSMKPEDVDDWADELGVKYRKFSERFISKL